MTTPKRKKTPKKAPSAPQGAKKTPRTATNTSKSYRVHTGLKKAAKTPAPAATLVATNTLVVWDCKDECYRTLPANFLVAKAPPAFASKHGDDATAEVVHIRGAVVTVETDDDWAGETGRYDLVTKPLSAFANARIGIVEVLAQGPVGGGTWHLMHTTHCACGGCGCDRPATKVVGSWNPHEGKHDLPFCEGCATHIDMPEWDGPFCLNAGLGKQCPTCEEHIAWGPPAKEVEAGVGTCGCENRIWLDHGKWGAETGRYGYTDGAVRS